jgi:hypothetical protein
MRSPPTEELLEKSSDKRFPTSADPEGLVRKIEELRDKRLSRTLRVRERRAAALLDEKIPPARGPAAASFPPKLLRWGSNGCPTWWLPPRSRRIPHEETIQ